MHFEFPSHVHHSYQDNHWWELWYSKMPLQKRNCRRGLLTDNLVLGSSKGPPHICKGILDLKLSHHPFSRDKNVYKMAWVWIMQWRLNITTSNITIVRLQDHTKCSYSKWEWSAKCSGWTKNMAVYGFSSSISLTNKIKVNQTGWIADRVELNCGLRGFCWLGSKTFVLK